MRYIDALILRDENKDDDDDCIDGQDERLYYLNDANMNVTALAEDDGDVLERYQYDPYGVVTFLKADWSLQEVSGHDDGTASAYDNPILFAGYYRDSETALYHVRNRMYHVQLGLWLIRDPEGYVDGMSLYEYARSNALRFLDPLGWDDIAVAAHGAGAEGAFKGRAAKMQPSKKGKKARTVKPCTGKELLEQLKKFSSKDNPIDRLNVHSHGYEKGVILSPEEGLYRSEEVKTDAKENAAFVKDLKEAVDKGEIVFAEDAEITLFGCKQDKLAKDISEALPGVEVTGGKGGVGPVDKEGKAIEPGSGQVEVGAKADQGFNTYKGGGLIKHDKGTKPYE